IKVKRTKVSTLQHLTREKETVMITEKQYLEYLIKQYQNLIYSICLKSVGNPFDAEDLTQEVFLSAYKNLSRFDGTYEKSLAK
ncbi:MAG: RNA polymerase sigma factor, partial [Blautia wexlerae]